MSVIRVPSLPSIKWIQYWTPGISALNTHLQKSSFKSNKCFIVASDLAWVSQCLSWLPGASDNNGHLSSEDLLVRSGGCPSIAASKSPNLTEVKKHMKVSFQTFSAPALLSRLKATTCHQFLSIRILCSLSGVKRARRGGRVTALTTAIIIPLNIHTKTVFLQQLFRIEGSWIWWCLDVNLLFFPCLIHHRNWKVCRKWDRRLQ